MAIDTLKDTSSLCLHRIKSIANIDAFNASNFAFAHIFVVFRWLCLLVHYHHHYRRYRRYNICYQIVPTPWSHTINSSATINFWHVAAVIVVVVVQIMRIVHASPKDAIENE